MNRLKDKIEAIARDYNDMPYGWDNQDEISYYDGYQDGKIAERDSIRDEFGEWVLISPDEMETIRRLICWIIPAEDQHSKDKYAELHKMVVKKIDFRF